MPETTGYIPFTVDRETYQTWYGIVGDIHSGRRPLVICHGDPDPSHDHLASFKQLHAHLNVPVIFYNQLGSGLSSHPQDVPEEFWRFDLWIDELDNLVEQLGIQDDFDLFGHSGNQMLAVNYVCDRHPPGLHRLILASGAPSTVPWAKSMRQIVHKLPKELRGMFERHETEGSMDDPEHDERGRARFADHLCKLKPWPDALLATFAAMEADPIVYRILLGAAEFTITGKLKDRTCLDKIHIIKNTTSTDDPIREMCLMPSFAKIQKVRWVTFSESNHVAFLDQSDRRFDVIGRYPMAGHRRCKL